ncbi:hypothetical protein RHGRI_001501 [Rhododendron griersonianum]|uniref:Uncharacterized protein n=1 Tax=Rhododendron griersonianum TaxID=479676 RepID=A0AAV6LKV2_9ERIC|nr:hypothetical protein RHGRI_001501 [Rhododendron griersonianum]
MWFNNSFKNLEKKCWESILFAGLWSIWIARNEVIFNNKHLDVAEVVDLIKTRVAFWIKAKFNITDYTVEDFKRGI